MSCVAASYCGYLAFFAAVFAFAFLTFSGFGRLLPNDAAKIFPFFVRLSPRPTRYVSLLLVDVNHSTVLDVRHEEQGESPRNETKFAEFGNRAAVQSVEEGKNPAVLRIKAGFFKFAF